LGLALVRDLRELRAPSNEDEVAAFEIDVLASTPEWTRGNHP